MARFLRSLLLATLLFLSPSLSLATNYCQDASVTGCWTFNESSGNLIDQSSNGNDATNTGVLQGQTGQFSNSYYYDGSSGSYSKKTSASSNTEIHSNLTIVSWVKDSLNITNGNVVYVAHDGDQSCWDWRQESSTFDILIPNVEDVLHSSTTITANTWTHGAATVDNSSPKNVIVYFNGVSNATTTTSSDFCNNVGTGITFGGNSFAASGLDGYLDEEAVFSSVLNSTQINDIKDNGLIPAAAAATPGLYKSTLYKSTWYKS